MTQGKINGSLKKPETDHYAFVASIEHPRKPETALFVADSINPQMDLYQGRERFFPWGYDRLSIRALAQDASMSGAKNGSGGDSREDSKWITSAKLHPDTLRRVYAITSLLRDLSLQPYVIFIGMSN